MLSSTCKKGSNINSFPLGSSMGHSQSGEETETSKEILKLVDTYHSINSGFKDHSPIEGGKVIIVGDANVGKTCMFMRASRNLFTNNYKPTIGLDFNFENYEIYGTPFTVAIWDTAGQERFKSLTKAYYRGSNAAVIAFSLNEEGTLKNVPHWINEVKKFSERPEIKIFLVGTKCDLYNATDRKQVQEIAKEHGVEYWEVSSKNDLNVKPLFDRIAYLIWEHQLLNWNNMREQKELETEIELENPTQIQRSISSVRCC